MGIPSEFGHVTVTGGGFNSSIISPFCPELERNAAKVGRPSQGERRLTEEEEMIDPTWMAIKPLSLSLPLEECQECIAVHFDVRE